MVEKKSSQAFMVRLENAADASDLSVPSRQFPASASVA